MSAPARSQAVPYSGMTVRELLDAERAARGHMRNARAVLLCDSPSCHSTVTEHADWVYESVVKAVRAARKAVPALREPSPSTGGGQ